MLLQAGYRGRCIQAQHEHLILFDGVAFPGADPIDARPACVERMTRGLQQDTGWRPVIRPGGDLAADAGRQGRRKVLRPLPRGAAGSDDDASGLASGSPEQLSSTGLSAPASPNRAAGASNFTTTCRGRYTSPCGETLRMEGRAGVFSVDSPAVPAEISAGTPAAIPVTAAVASATSMVRAVAASVVPACAVIASLDDGYSSAAISPASSQAWPRCVAPGPASSPGKRWAGRRRDSLDFMASTTQRTVCRCYEM